MPACDGKRGLALATTGDADGCGLTWLCHLCGCSGGHRDGGASTERRPAPNIVADRVGPCWHTDDAPRATQVASEIWRTSIPLWSAGAEPAVGYLRDTRQIPPPYPETLAYCRLRHPETGERDVPCLVVARHCPTVRMVRSIQRIFLTENGEKYARGTAKLSLGKIAGGRAELLWPDAELAIAEGVESALSAWRLLRTAAWAMCGGFPATIALPDRVSRVTLVADHDAAGGSEAKARVLAQSIRATGRTCSVIMPDLVGADANDVLRSVG